MLLREPGELVPVLLQRVRHDVERPFERHRSRRPRSPACGRQVAAGEPVGHQRRLPDRPNDHPRQVTGEERMRRIDPAAPTAAPATATPTGPSALRSRAASVSAPLARNAVNSSRIASMRRLPSAVAARLRAEDRSGARPRKHGQCVVADVGRDVLLDLPDPGELDRLAGDTPLQGAWPAGKARARVVPGLERAIVPCQDIPAQARLEVDHQRLERVRRDELLPDVASRLRQLAEVVDREQHRDEARDHDDREERARNRDTARQTASHQTTRRCSRRAVSRPGVSFSGPP